MNTKQLRYLVTIAQFGSLSRASQALGVSQPALSKALAEWENTYGFLFFLRYRRKLSPTAAGRYMIEAAQKILDEQNRMLLTMRAVMGDERQNIRLCTAPNRAAIIYSQIYHDFSRRYPDITLQLAERYASEQPKAVQRGQVDLALGAGPVTDVVEDIPFAREVLLVALPASHPLAGQKSVRLEELKDTPFVLQGERHSIRTIADELFRKAGFLPVVAFESNDVLLLDAMMHQAIGAGFVSNIHVFPCEDLVYLPLDPPVYQLTHIRYPKGHELTEAERYLAGLLIRHRLSDPRYEAIRSPKVKALLDAVTETEQEALPGMMKADGAGVHELREISLDTSALERIVAIVEEGSLSRAAQRFYLAQPALSRILHNVEEMLGVDLFSRDHNRLNPTNAGKIFVNGARNMLRYEAEMEAYIKAYRKGHGGRLFVHCDTELADIFREQVEPAFKSICPEVSIALVEGNADSIREALMNASTDIGIFMTDKRNHSVLRQHLFCESEWRYCIASDSAASALRESETIARKLPSRRVMLAPEGTTLRRQQDKLMADLYEAEPKVVCQAELPLLRELAHRGGADVLMPLHLLSDRAKAHSLKLPSSTPLYLVLAVNPSRTLPESAQMLEELSSATFVNFFHE